MQVHPACTVTEIPQQTITVHSLFHFCVFSLFDGFHKYMWVLCYDCILFCIVCETRCLRIDYVFSTPWAFVHRCKIMMLWFMLPYTYYCVEHKNDTTSISIKWTNNEKSREKQYIRSFFLRHFFNTHPLPNAK